MSFLVRLTTRLTSRPVGSDTAGNAYYESRRRMDSFGRPRRYVLFAGTPEASAVPAEWWGWLHHVTDAPLSTEGRRPWQKEHLPNRTGTPLAYRPAGHDLSGGRRAITAGDYEAWTPGS